MTWAAPGILAVVCLAAVCLYPRRCEATGDWLYVRTLIFCYRFDLRRALSMRPVMRSEVTGWGTVRLFGIGWPLPLLGWFRNRGLGTFLNLADDPTNLWLIRFPSRQIVVSPSRQSRTLHFDRLIAAALAEQPVSDPQAVTPGLRGTAVPLA